MIGGRERLREAHSDTIAIGRTVDAVARRLPIEAKCLPRALTTWTLLRWAGVSAIVHIGLRLDEPADAHAWVELNGHPLIEYIDTSLLADFDLADHLPAALVGRAT